MASRSREWTESTLVAAFRFRIASPHAARLCRPVAATLRACLSIQRKGANRPCPSLLIDSACLLLRICMGASKRERLTELPEGRLQELAEQKRLSLDQLASKANVSLHTVQRANSGKTTYTTRIEELAAGLDLPIAVLRGEEPAAQSKRAIADLIDAVGDGEEFAYLGIAAAKQMVTKSQGHPAVEESVRKYVKLCAGAKQRTREALQLLWRCLLVQGNSEGAEGVAEGLIEAADTEENRARAERAVGEVFFYRGRFVDALRHLDSRRSRETAEDWTDEPLGLDGRVTAIGHAALALATLGRVEVARARIDEALRIAHESQHGPSVVFAMHCDSVLSVFLNEACEARAKAEAVKDLAVAADATLFYRLAQIVEAWGAARTTGTVDGLSLLPLLLYLRRNRSRVASPLWWSLAADVACRAGHHAIGVFLFGEAECEAESTGSTFFAAETERTQAEFLASAVATRADALDRFKAAARTARNQGANLFELRALRSARRTATRTREKAALQKQIVRVAKKVDSGRS